jgi:ubiquinone/menaquinone biosynthesis C-methylase UbiE
MCNEPGWRSQFGHPRGFLGWLAGHLMARKNAAMNETAVELLQVEPGDAVLEIGFGHGRTLSSLVDLVGQVEHSEGFVAGVDPSQTMLRQARRWNRTAVRSGRLDLAEASAERISHADARFDKVIAVNCFQHWEQPEQSLAEVWRILKPGGTLLLGLRLHDDDEGRFSAPGFRPEQIEAAERLVKQAGFTRVRREQRSAGRKMIALIATA